MGIYDRQYYNSDDLNPIQMGWNSRSMVTTIIIINCVVHFLGLALQNTINLAPLFWLHANEIFSPLNWYRYLSYGFLHATGIQHILFNMLSLFFLGQAVEQKYGRNEFLRIYLVSIVLCGLAWTVSRMVNRDSSAVLLGASGAVTTIVMLFVFSFPNAILRIWGVFPVRAWVVGVLLVGVNIMGNHSIDLNGRSQVAYDVHLFGAGLAAIYFFSRWNFGKIWAKYSGYIGSLPFFGKGLRVYQPPNEDDIPPKMQREADRILEKIHRDGQDSLTSKERRLMEDYSRKMRKRRRHR